MEEKVMTIAFNIITHSGEAKFEGKEALSLAKKGDFKNAIDKLNSAREILNNAHRSQTELITDEVNGLSTPLSVILIHSQDHLMTTISYLELVEEFISMYELIYNK